MRKGTDIQRSSPIDESGEKRDRLQKPDLCLFLGVKRGSIGAQ